MKNRRKKRNNKMIKMIMKNSKNPRPDIRPK
jgi:hypothetical protein